MPVKYKYATDFRTATAGDKSPGKLAAVKRLERGLCRTAEQSARRRWRAQATGNQSSDRCVDKVSARHSPGLSERNRVDIEEDGARDPRDRSRSR
jgi:hypothetical protein